MTVLAVELLDIGTAILLSNKEQFMRPLLLYEPERVLLVDSIKIDKAADNGLRVELGYKNEHYILDVTGHYAFWQ